MDRNRIGRLCRDDVVCSLESLNYDGAHLHELFDLLDRQGYGWVVPRDLSYLKKWKPRKYLFVAPDHQAMKQIKDGFILVHQSLWRAWRQALDTDCTMRVSWEEFFIACKRLLRQVRMKGLNQPLPHTEEGFAAAWRALDDDCSGWIALKEFDATCFKVLKSFKLWAMEEHGGCVAALRKLDANKNAELSAYELKKSNKQPNGYPGDVDSVFEYLDVDRQKNLGENEVKFLDDWDLAWEEYEESSKGRRTTKAAVFRSRV